VLAIAGVISRFGITGFVCREKSIKQNDLIELLEELKLSHETVEGFKEYVLVFDNCSVHKGKMVQRKLEELKEFGF